MRSFNPARQNPTEAALGEERSASCLDGASLAPAPTHKKFRNEELLDHLAHEVWRGRMREESGVVSYTSEAQRSRDKLAVEAIEIVAGICSRLPRLAPNPPDKAELFSSGCLGLMRAIDGFDPERGGSFSAYAARCIRGQLQEDLGARQAFIEIDGAATQDLRAIKRFEDRFLVSRGRLPEPEETAEGVRSERIEQKLRLHPEAVGRVEEPGFVRPLSADRVAMLKDSRPVVESISAPRRNSKNLEGDSFEDLFQNSKDVDILEAIAEREVIDRLENLIDKDLTEKQRSAVLRYYGFANPQGAPEPAPKIAQDWGTSSSNVHKVVTDALNKLRVRRHMIDPERAGDSERSGAAAVGTRQRDGHLFWTRSAQADWLEVKAAVARLHGELGRPPKPEEVSGSLKAARRLDAALKHELEIADPALNALVKKISDARIETLIDAAKPPKDLVAKAVKKGIDPFLPVDKQGN